MAGIAATIVAAWRARPRAVVERGSRAVRVPWRAVSEDTNPAWLGHEGYFRSVRAWVPVTDLFLDPRLHADFLPLLESVGVSPDLLERMRPSLLNMNGEEHRAVRAVAHRFFTPRAAERVRPLAAARAAELVERIADLGSCELVADVAVPFVADTTAVFLGIPPSEAEHILTDVQTLNRRGAPKADVDAATRHLLDFADQILDHAPRSGDDVLSLIASAVRDGDLDRSAAVALVVSILSPGHDASVRQLTLVVEVMSQHPDVWDAIATGAQDLAPVLEECLRLRPANGNPSRRVAETLEYDGVTFREGELVVLDIGAANRDRARYDEADRLCPAGRPPHLTFGYGAHFCLGAGLARVQLQEALCAMVTRLTCPSVEQPCSGGDTRSGYSELTIRFERRDDPPATNDAPSPSGTLPA